ncbi:MAG: UvrD-helicase domain-containing protein [Christensenellales bacterium]
MAKIEWKDAQKSVLDDSGNMLVSASAGTGKTTVMLEKVIRLLDQGHNIDRFLIITFSKASAAEMKEKLIKQLFEKLREGGDNIHLKKQLDLIDFSNISTIDSFFYNIFKMFYAQIGYDPSFEVADEKESNLIFNQSIEEVIEEYLHKEDMGFFNLMERFIRSRDISPLKKAIMEISIFLNKQKDIDAFEQKAVRVLNLSLEKTPAVSFYVAYHKKTLRKYRAELENIVEEVCIKAPDLFQKYKDYINNIFELLKNIYTKENFEDFCQAIKVADIPRKPGPRNLLGIEAELNDDIGLFHTSFTKYVKEFQAELEQNPIEGKRLKESVKDVKKLLEIVLSVRERYLFNKQKRKKLDFADLSTLALKILSIESCREKIKDQFDFIFVDEYQDTNYIQEEIIKLCSKGDNLFMVGDPKQSIYQFRDAEPQIFLDRYHIYETSKGGGKNKNLNDNFRSDHRILEFINMVFGEIMSEDFGGVNYKKNALLVPDKPFPKVSSLPAVEIFEYQSNSKAEQPKGIYSVKEHTQASIQQDIQAKYVADKILSLVGKEYIYDKKLNEKRLIKFNDIAILMYKRDDKIIKELEARQIPFSAPGFSEDKVYEIELIVDYLRIINNMTDDIALTSVMLSPLYSFSPKEMLEIRKNSLKDAFWESLIEYNGNQTLEFKIKTLLDNIDRYKKMSWHLSVYELMLTILSEGFDALILKKGEKATERINNFINSVKGREFSRSVTSFLEYYDNAEREDFELSTMGDAVKISTIHKSKGLEFPVVFVVDADKGYDARFDSERDLFLDNDFGIAIKHFDHDQKTKSHTLLTKSFLLKKRHREIEECMRLMYVAFTRAQNHLFISGKKQSKEKLFSQDGKSFIEWLCYTARQNPKINDYICKDEIVFETQTEQKIEVVSEKPKIDFGPLVFEYKHKTATQMPLKYSVTSLKDFEYSEEFTYSKNSYLTGQESIERGIFYHKVFQLIDFEKREGLDIRRQLEEFAEKGLLDEDETREADITLIENILKSQIIDYAIANKYFREKPFMLYVPMNELLDTDCTDKVLVQGVIDLLIIGEKNYIVDFKVTQSKSSNAMKTYQKQLSIYRMAVEEITGLKVEKTFVYLVLQNELVSV